MAVTPSNMLPLGTKAPDFSLLDTVSGDVKKLDDLKSDKATVILFICNHCPYVKHLQAAIVHLANEYQQKGVAFIAINANDIIQYPDDSPENMADEAKQHHYPFPYLYDDTQAVAKAYQAACTPDFYIFDKDLLCVYRGRFDGSTPGNDIPVTGEDIGSALDCLLSEQPIKSQQIPSMGCNIKWK
jgi:peroxiredoxin